MSIVLKMKGQTRLVLLLVLALAAEASPHDPVTSVPSSSQNVAHPGQDADGHEDGHKSKGIHIFTVDLAHVQAPFVILLTMSFACIAKLAFHRIPKLLKIFPESCLLILVGMVIGVVLFYANSIGLLPLTPTSFFFYLLPPIILDAGYFMPNRAFFDHLGTIILFAVLGTLWNTVTIGLSLWGVGLTGLYGIELPLLDTFLFSALISAVDPVAVLAVFEEIHVNEILYIIVFGESLLNDAVTVVLYNMFDSYIEMGQENIGCTDMLSGVALFLVVALGGTFIGVFFGFLIGLVTRFTKSAIIIEPIFLFFGSYLAYLTAEIFHMSGICAIMFCGITMKNYVEANISPKSHTTFKYGLKMISHSSETLIFMLLGVNTIPIPDWNTITTQYQFILLTILFCSVFRSIGCIVLAQIANRFRLQKLNNVEKFVMSYGGLRGAVAFALVHLIDKNKVPHQPLFVTATLSVIFFTVFVQGMTIKPLVQFLKVKRANKFTKTMNERNHEKMMDYTMAGIEGIIGGIDSNTIRGKFKRFDNRYIRPLLIRNHQAHEPKILETFSKLTMKDAMEKLKTGSKCSESMAVYYRNYTSQKENQEWNFDIEELVYSPSGKDLLDAKIHHLLPEETPKSHRGKSFTKKSYHRNFHGSLLYSQSGNSKKLVHEYLHALIKENCGVGENSSLSDDSNLSDGLTVSLKDQVTPSIPSAAESQLPWKHDGDSDSEMCPVKQTEFKCWVEDEECINHHSSITFSNGLESFVRNFQSDSTMIQSSPGYCSVDTHEEDVVVETPEND